jgi:hypothetical protein
MQEKEKLRLLALVITIRNISARIEDLKIQRNLLLDEFRKFQPQSSKLKLVK